MILLLKILKGIVIIGGVVFSFRSLIYSKPQERLWKFAKTISIVFVVILLLTLIEFQFFKL